MVNLDPGRDYYADLEVAPQASINEVRKQFRKLALKYHPDRNPGQELEYNSKFQAISAANEILADPALRAKYDAQRLRDGPPKAFGDQPARPYVPPRNRTTNFPPPPRPPPPTAHKSTFSPPPPTGGPRRHAPAPRPASHFGPVDPDEAKAKTNDFKAWEQMRHGQGPIFKSRPPPSRTPKTATFEPDRASPPRKASDGISFKARRTWEDLLDAGMSNIGKYSGRLQPNKSGYLHGSPEEDELHANQSAYHVFKGDHFNFRKATDMPPPPPPPRSGRKPEPGPTPVKEPYGHNQARFKVPPPYQPSSSERLNAAGPGLHRASTSATPRETKPGPAWTNVDSVRIDGEHLRATSAGAAHRNEPFRTTGVSSSTTSETTSSASSDAETEVLFERVPAGRERKVPKSRKARMPAGAGVHLPSGFSPHTRQDEGQAPHPGYTDFRTHNGIDTSGGNSNSERSEVLNARPRMRSGSSQVGISSPGPSASPAPGDRFPQRHRSFDGRYHSPPAPDGSRSPFMKTNVRNPIFQSMANNGKSHTPPPPLRSQSSETITTKFSPAPSPPKSGADNPFVARRSSRYDTDSTVVPPDSEAKPSTSPPSRETTREPADIPPPPKLGTKWSSEEWEKRFGAHTFDIPASGASSRATSRKRSGTPKTGSLNNLKRAGTFRTNSFQPTVIDDSEDPLGFSDTLKEDLQREVSNSRTSNTSDGNAMDIDMTPPHATENDVSPSAKVSKSVPIGHGTDVSEMNENSESDLSASKMDLGGFRHVAPFSSTNEGLGGTDDLKSALPFESRPSSSKPDFAKCYEKLELPNPPRQPSPPGGLDDMIFARYISAMNHYIYNWNNFSTKTIMLFHRRQEEHREIGQGWIGQVGGDCDAYLHALDEDERGRATWDKACEKHKATMQNLKMVREKMLKAKGNA